MIVSRILRAALLMLGAAIAAAPATAAPPLDVYGRLPETEMVAMSLSGKRIALVATVKDQRRLIVLEDGKVILSQPFGDQKVRSLRWAGDENVLMQVSRTFSLAVEFTGSRSEMTSVIVIPVDKAPVWAVFERDKEVFAGVRGIYGMSGANDRFGYFGGIATRLDRASVQVNDGRGMSGVLTLPPGRPAKNLPVILLPHGGPRSQDEPVFDWWAQAMASRGYAVFQPNFRGSTGFGRAFEQAGWGEWGRKMQTDISDGLAALAKEGIVDPKRACIMGGSYGGYAALAGVTLQQNIYRCAVSVAGVGNVAKLVATKWRESGGSSFLNRYYHQQIGTGRDYAAISPVNLAAKADAPVLLIHGVDDIVVPFDQSSDMAAALTRAGKPVEFVKLPGEDHWLSRGETRLAMLKAAVAFIEKHNPPDPAPAR